MGLAPASHPGRRRASRWHGVPAGVVPDDVEHGQVHLARHPVAGLGHAEHVGAVADGGDDGAVRRRQLGSRAPHPRPSRERRQSRRRRYCAGLGELELTHVEAELADDRRVVVALLLEAVGDPGLVEGALVLAREGPFAGRLRAPSRGSRPASRPGPRWPPCRASPSSAPSTRASMRVARRGR